MVLKTQENMKVLPTVYIGRIVHSRSLQNLEILPNAALGVRADGTIAFLHPNAENIEDILEMHDFTSAETVRLNPSQFSFPGMVDTHLHAPQWPNLALGMEGNLREWIEEWTDPTEVLSFARSASC